MRKQYIIYIDLWMGPEKIFTNTGFHEKQKH